MVVCVLAGFVPFCFAAAFCLSTRLLRARLRRDSDWSGGVENIALRFSERARGLGSMAWSWSGLSGAGGAPVPADTIRYGVESRLTTHDSRLTTHEQVFMTLFSALVRWFEPILRKIVSSELCIIEKQRYLHGHLIPAFFSLGTELCLAGSDRG